MQGDSEAERKRRADLYAAREKADQDYVNQPLLTLSKTFITVNLDPDVVYGKRTNKAFDPTIGQRAVGEKDALFWAALVNEKNQDENTVVELLNKYFNEGANINSYSLHTEGRPSLFGKGIIAPESSVWRTPLLYAFYKYNMYGGANMKSVLDFLLQHGADTSLIGIHRFLKYDFVSNVSKAIASETSLRTAVDSRYDFNKVVDASMTVSIQDRNILFEFCKARCSENSVLQRSIISAESIKKLLQLGANIHGTDFITYQSLLSILANEICLQFLTKLFLHLTEEQKTRFVQAGDGLKRIFLYCAIQDGARGVNFVGSHGQEMSVENRGKLFSMYELVKKYATVQDQEKWRIPANFGSLRNFELYPQQRPQAQPPPRPQAQPQAQPPPRPQAQPPPRPEPRERSRSRSPPSAQTNGLDYFTDFTLSSPTALSALARIGISKQSVLSLPEDERKAFIKKAYIRKSLQVHPDKGGSVEEFQRLGNAKAYLIGGAKRSRSESPSPPSSPVLETFSLAAMSTPRAQQALAILGLSLQMIMSVPERDRQDLIKRAYFQRSLQVHPDRGGSPDDFQLVTSAKTFLIGGSVKTSKKSRLRKSKKSKSYRSRSRR